MLYQRKTLPSILMGEPAPLPAALVGLSDECLADLSASVPQAAQELGYAGQGFFPVPPPPPPPPPGLERIDFLRLFTDPELVAILQEATTNPMVALYQYKLSISPRVLLNDPDILAGLPALEALGLLGPGRAAQILAGQAP